MNPEQLLQPRFEVIADYPGNNVEVGTIIVQTDPVLWQAYLDQYPHLFRKMQWWEKRKPEEMPEWVKERNIIYPASWEMDDGELIMVADGARWVATVNIMRHCKPATAADYEQYKNDNP